MACRIVQETVKAATGERGEMHWPNGTSQFGVVADIRVTHAGRNPIWRRRRCSIPGPFRRCRPMTCIFTTERFLARRLSCR